MLTRSGQRHPSLSELLASIVADQTRERVSIGDLLDTAGDRAFGALLFIFALPNLVPTPPGTSSVLGLPLVMLSAQLLFGRRTPWLPKLVAARSIARANLASVVTRAMPVLKRTESVLKPRLRVLVSPVAERLLAVILLLLSVLIFLPIPFGNIPPAAAICIMALAFVEHDGLAAIIGVLVGLASMFLVWGAIVALFRAAAVAWEHLGIL